MYTPFSSTLLLYILLTVALVSAAQAQPNNPPKSPPQPATTNSTAPKIKLLITQYIPSTNISVRTGEVLRSLMERLKESSGLEVTLGKELNRKEAIERAKAEQETYVVWLQLEVDAADTERATIGQVNPDSLIVNYVVYMPGTGKVKTQGRVYQRSSRESVSIMTSDKGKPGVVAVGKPINLPKGEIDDYALRRAGREAADRLLTEFGLSIQP
jgi:hypothetical protein